MLWTGCILWQNNVPAEQTQQVYQSAALKHVADDCVRALRMGGQRLIRNLHHAATPCGAESSRDEMMSDTLKVFESAMHNLNARMILLIRVLIWSVRVKLNNRFV